MHRLIVIVLAFAVGWGVAARAQDSGSAQYLAGAVDGPHGAVYY
jgi:hypothetical protein